MTNEDVTSVQVKVSPTWERLNNLKRPGDSMDDVIRELLSAYEDAGEVEADGGVARARGD